MPQIFSPSTNTLVRTAIAVGILLVCLSGWALYAVYWSPYTTRVAIPLSQPVPFSHKHHVTDLGLDCRFCHTSVENSPFAGLPATEICMTCHSQLYTDASLLAPVRQSLVANAPLKWNRVNDVPDFVFFDHGIHVNKGIGCSTCHGPVDQMPLAWKQNTLYMKWCLGCHREPARFIRPKSEVFNMAWSATNQAVLGRALMAQYHVRLTQLADCGMCHR